MIIFLWKNFLQSHAHWFQFNESFTQISQLILQIAIRKIFIVYVWNVLVFVISFIEKCNMESFEESNKDSFIIPGHKDGNSYCGVCLVYIIR